MEVEWHPRINVAARGVRKPLRQVRRPPEKIARWRYTVKILFSANGSNERTKRNPHPFYLRDYTRFTPVIIPQTAFNPP